MERNTGLSYYCTYLDNKLTLPKIKEKVHKLNKYNATVNRNINIENKRMLKAILRLSPSPELD